MDLHENMAMHLIHTHGRSLEEVRGRDYDDLKAEHDGLECPPRPEPEVRYATLPDVKDVLQEQQPGS